MRLHKNAESMHKKLNNLQRASVVAAWSKAWVCGHSLAGIVGLNGRLFLVSVVCCQVEVSASSCSLFRGVVECDVSE